MTTSPTLSPNVLAMLPNPTPRALGYRMPAEWTNHQGTWFSWPHNADTWSNHLASAELALADAVQWLSQGEAVHINVLNDAHRAHVARLVEQAGATDQVFFHNIPTNDSWCRDHGAIFLTHPGQPGLAAIDWGYNAWGGKYPPFDLDNAVPLQMSQAMGALRFETPMVLEGGSVEVSGDGVLMTTSTCLLNPNRNPGLKKHEVEYVLREMLGVDTILWLAGELAGDDTDGHIDNLARFVNNTTIVMPHESNRGDVNHKSLSDNLALVEAWNKVQGNKYNIIQLPMPAPCMIDGRRMPANYMNFYIGNKVVLMPVFGDPNDELARTILQSCFENREIIPINCRNVIWGLGAIHCLTQQVPDGTI